MAGDNLQFCIRTNDLMYNNMQSSSRLQAKFGKDFVKILTLNFLNFQKESECESTIAIFNDYEFD